MVQAVVAPISEAMEAGAYRLEMERDREARRAARVGGSRGLRISGRRNRGSVILLDLLP